MCNFDYFPHIGRWKGRAMKRDEERPSNCRSCRHFSYQPCYVAGKFEMAEHCGKWIKSFPDATGCDLFDREPGSDDE